MSDTKHDLVIIGAGPGGYVAAIRAAQLGWNVACVEEEQELGGTCLRIGCIPSKALLESSEHYWEARHSLAVHGILASKVSLDLQVLLRRKDEIVKSLTQGVAALFKKNNVTRYTGHGSLAGPDQVRIAGGKGGSLLRASRILIATGSKVAPLAGVEWDGDRIAGSTQALSYPEVPGHLVVIGAGAIGLELGSVWLRLGAKVTVLEYLDRILPGMDSETAAEAHKLFRRQGLDFQLGCRIQTASVVQDQCVVTREAGDPIRCDRVLVAAGRIPNTDGLGLESVGIQLDEEGRIPVDEHFQTRIPGIHAIGDVIRGPMLAHKAEEEGVACVEHLITGYGHVNYDAIPSIVYTHPEIASVGKTEDELKQNSVQYRKGAFLFRANGRARCLGQIDGKIKILADESTDRILGVHIVGARAGDLIAEAVVAMEFGASSEDLARSCHAHPTLSEVLKEAALAVDDRAIHS